MPFNTYTFLLFFLAVLAIHNLPLPWPWKKTNLLVASYLFYAAWNPPFVALLVVSTITDWYAAIGIGRAPTRGRKRAWLGLSLLVNLGLLGFFKYGGFVVGSFTALARSVGLDYEPLSPDVILPLGISFYTFQTLSYSLDVYHGRFSPWRSFRDYALYVTFFPQLVAGPIVRANQFLPQCERPGEARFGWGASLLLIGLFQKIVLADGIFAPVAEAVYRPGAAPSALDAWTGTFAFGGQIYCDFGGYSLCAIGAALCLGFRLPDNFNFPYGAVGFSDFWRRWHMSLSGWLRDYVYIPLGGNRRGPGPSRNNLMVTMLVGGLWHGASWTFVAWGGLHGGYLVAERILRRGGRFDPSTLRAAAAFPLAIVTFVLVNLAWVFFRAESFPQAFGLVATMLGRAPEEADRALAPSRLVFGLGIMLLIFVASWLMRNRSFERVALSLPWWLRSICLAAMALAIVTMSGDDEAFLYFQF